MRLLFYLPDDRKLDSGSLNLDFIFSSSQRSTWKRRSTVPRPISSCLSSGCRCWRNSSRLCGGSWLTRCCTCRNSEMFCRGLKLSQMSGRAHWRNWLSSLGEDIFLVWTTLLHTGTQDTPRTLTASIRCIPVIPRCIRTWRVYCTTTCITITSKYADFGVCEETVPIPSQCLRPLSIFCTEIFCFWNEKIVTWCVYILLNFLCNFFGVSPSGDIPTQHILYLKKRTERIFG